MSTLLPPLIPENAPFSSAQRAWLNGFFAGMFGSSASNGSGIAVSSNLAASTNGAAVAEPVAVEEDFAWHDASLPLDERLVLAEGKPLARKLMAAMAQLDCGACGYLCQSYGEAIATGTEKDLTRCSPGGSETAKKLKQLVSLEAVPTNVVSATNGQLLNGKATTTPATSAFSRNNPYTAKLVEVAKLNQADSDKDTRQVVFDLGDSGLTYLPGDSLGVVPQNCGELVAEVLAALRIERDTPVTLATHGTKSAFEALRQHCTIHKVTDGIVSLLASSAQERSQEQELRGLLAEDAQGFLEHADLLDVLRRFPSIFLTAERLIPMLPPIHPRLYSIASSQAAHPTQVHLIVGVVRFQKDQRQRKGVCSTYLAERATADGSVPIFVQTSHGFRLPADGKTPIVMIGPGTGIAPFRAFLQERLATGATGGNWLFFGDQRSSCDFLYREELDSYQQRGLLTRCDTAFSRDQAHKVYVQDRMREQGRELYRWLMDGAYFYVCGDAKRMAPDVDAALVAVVAEHGQVCMDEAKATVRQWTKQKRYLRDVY